MLILEACQQGVADRAGRELPDRFELIVEKAVRIVLRAQLPAHQRVSGNVSARRARAVIVAHDVNRAICVREVIADG